MGYLEDINVFGARGVSGNPLLSVDDESYRHVMGPI